MLPYDERKHMIRVGRRVGLWLAVACTAAATMTPVCPGQSSTTVHKKSAPKPKPKPEPTPAELFELIRGSLLSYSPDDQINDNLEVTIDSTGTVLTIKQPDGHCDQFLNAMDANTLVWDVYDASDSVTSRQPLLRLSVISVPGKNARVCYDNDGQVDQNIPSNRARFLFLLAKIPDQIPFQIKISKALKKLIAQSGGDPEKDIFKNP